MNKDEKLRRKRILRWQREMEESEREIGNVKRTPNEIMPADWGDPFWYARDRIRERKAWIAAAGPMPQTEQEKLGKKRKPYERGESVAEQKAMRAVKRKYPDLFKPQTDFEEPSIASRELDASFDYEDDLRFLNRDIGQAHQDNDVPRLRALKKERNDLTRRYPLGWRTWLRHPVDRYRATGMPEITQLHQAFEDALTFLAMHRWPPQKHKDSFWGKRLPDETFDRNLGIDADVLATKAENLLKAILSAMKKQRAALKLRSEITHIEGQALKRLYESLGVPFNLRLICFDQWARHDGPIAFIKLAKSY